MTTKFLQEEIAQFSWEIFELISSVAAEAASANRFLNDSDAVK